MLRQSATENKASKVPDSVTVSGQVYHKADYEDSEHPGYTKPGRLYSSAELHACGLWDLTAPNGHRFNAHLPVQLPADPTRVSASEAPEGLRRAVGGAEKRLQEAAAKVSAALEARTDAEEAQLLAARRQDKKAYNAAIVAAQEAEQLRLDVEMALPPLRVEVSRANQALRWWMEDEGLRRQGHVEESATTVF